MKFMHGMSATFGGKTGKTRYLKVLRFSHWMFLAFAYGFLLAKSLLQFSRLPDLLAFHLPRALQYFGLTTYQFGSWAVEQAKGYPPLPNYLQGMLVWATGHMSAANAVNAIGFLLACVWIRALFPGKWSLRWFATFCLCLPIFYYHMSVGFIDLFTASMLLLAYAGVHGLALRQRTFASGCTAAAGISLAMLSSMTAWPVAAFFSVCCLYFLWDLAYSRRMKRYQAAILGIFVLCGASFYPLRNYLLFGNPTYPVEVRAVVNLFPEISVISPIEQPNFPKAMGKQSEPVKFVYSLFEMNRFDSVTPFSWSSFEKHGTVFHRDNAGGFFTATMVLAVLMLLWGFFRNILPSRSIAVLGFATAMVATLPNYSVMRYSLFVPLIAFFLIAFHLPGFERRVRRVFLCGMLLCLPVVMSNLGDTFWTIDTREPGAFASKAAQEFWKENKKDANDLPVHISGAYPNTIFWTGPDFNTYKVVEDLDLEGRFKNTLIEVER